MKHNNFICQICKKEFKYKKGLSKHLSYTHKIDLKEYYDSYIKKDNEGICPVCKKETNFRNFRDGYRKLCDLCINKSKFPSNKEYWIYHGFSEKESIKKCSKFQQEQSKKVKNRANCRSINYWIKAGLSEEEAINKVKEIQSTNSLNNFIKRYGKKKGKIKWKERQAKWQETLQNKPLKEKQRINSLKGITLENMIRKWGEIDGPEKYNDWKNAIIKNGNRSGSISHISQELFFILLKDIKDKNNVKFGKHNKEFYIKYKNKCYFYDFKYKNKIIEFNGDLFHANPKLYEDYDNPNPYNKNLTAKQIWNIDNIKMQLAKNKGYEILVIWESEYKKDKNSQITICKNFING